MAGWHDSLDAMMDISSWWRTQAGIGFGNHFIESVMSRASGMIPRPDVQLESGWLAKTARQSLAYAEPIFVTNEVMDIIDYAAFEADPPFRLEPLHETDIMTPYGFVLLPRPFYSRDNSGNVIANRAFSWSPAYTSVGQRYGIYLMIYSSPSDPRDSSFRDVKEMVSQLGTTATRYLLWHLSPWWFDEAMPTFEEYVRGDEDLSGKSTIELWRWLEIFFRFSMQHVVTADRRTPPRPFARRAKRAGRDPGILVVTLRRPKQRGQEGEGRWEMTVRSLTRGHWRNQWYPALKAHRQIWINAYIRGPEDAPLKTPSLRVFDVRR